MIYTADRREPASTFKGANMETINELSRQLVKQTESLVELCKQFLEESDSEKGMKDE